MTRGRLTLVDIIYLGVGIAVLAILARPFYKILEGQASVLSTGEAYLLQLVIPGLVATLMIVMLATAVNKR
jgi:hypothetical protein